MPETLKVNGTDLATYVVIEDLSEVMVVGPTAQEFITIPGRAGAVFVDGVRDAYSFNVPMVVLGANRGDVNAGLVALAALLDSRSDPLVLTRVYTRDVGGTDYDATDWCHAAVVSSWEVDYLGDTAARVVATFQNLTGGWTAGTLVVAAPA